MPYNHDTAVLAAIATLYPAFIRDMLPADAVGIETQIVAPGDYVDTPDSYGTIALACATPIYSVHSCNVADFYSYVLADALAYVVPDGTAGYALHIALPLAAPDHHPNHSDNRILVVTFMRE